MSAPLEAPAPTRAGVSARRARGPAVPPAAPVPLHAVAVVVGAWLLFGVLVFIYGMMALILLPLLPLFLFGPVCLLSWAHAYAEEARERRPRAS